MAKNILQNRGAARQPQVRQYIKWTPPLIESARLMADAGDFRMLADLVEWCLADDRCAATADTRISNLLGRPLHFESAGDKRRSARPVRALEVEDDFWAIAPEAELTQWLLWGFALGFAWANLDYGERKGRVIPSLRFWHPRNTRFDWDARQWFTRQGKGDSQSETRIDPGDGRWVLFAPYGRFRPWSHGLWRGLSRWILFKSFAIDDWGRHSERAATWVASSEPLAGQSGKRDGGGVDASVRNQLASDIRTMGAMGTIALPPGVKLDLLEATANTRQMYEAQVDASNVAIAISWLGGNLSTEVKEGSFAAAKSQAKGGELGRTRADAAKVATDLHDQALTWWAEFNFGDRGLAPWPVWEVEDEQDEASRAETLQKASAAATAFDKLGLNVDWQKFAEEFNIPLVEGEDPIKQVEPPAPPKPPAQPAAPPPADPNAPPPDQAPPPGKPAAAMALASGDVLARATGFASGQAYADAVADHAEEQAGKALSPFLRDMLELVDGATDLEAVRGKLADHYRDAAGSPKFAELVERVWRMTQVAGAAAVLEDTPEIKD